MEDENKPRLKGLTPEQRRRALREWSERWLREAGDEEIRRVMRSIFSEEDEGPEPERA